MIPSSKAAIISAYTAESGTLSVSASGVVDYKGFHI
jgi:hypothetical protein